MQFKFSITDSLREVWAIFKKHFWFLVCLSAVSFAIGLLGGGRTRFILEIALLLLSFFWSIVMIKFSLFAIDGKEDKLNFSKIKEAFPDWKEFVGMLAVSLSVAFLLLIGFGIMSLSIFGFIFAKQISVVFVILAFAVMLAGFWMVVRLSLANFIFLDKKTGVKDSLKSSWKMTKGSTFWTVLLVALVSGLLYFIGVLIFGFGLVVTYPIAMLLMAKFYRAVDSYQGGASHSVVVQPAEIVAPEVKEVHQETEA